ncbi:hypothetical protein ACP70R_025379 [Stipagrostis hirtigluma subsp. patula]
MAAALRHAARKLGGGCRALDRRRAFFPAAVSYSRAVEEEPRLVHGEMPPSSSHRRRFYASGASDPPSDGKHHSPSILEFIASADSLK